jgi:hypothetical protein
MIKFIIWKKSPYIIHLLSEDLNSSYLFPFLTPNGVDFVILSIYDRNPMSSYSIDNHTQQPLFPKPFSIEK